MAKQAKKIVQSLIRVGYCLAYFIWRFVKRYLKKTTQGAQVVVWNNGRFLLVKTSYRNSYCFPGGYVKTDENPIDAAVRELKEETGIRVTKHQLSYLYQVVDFCGTTQCFDILYEMTLGPGKLNELKVDNKEIVEAGFFKLSELSGLSLDDTVLSYLKHFPFKTYGLAK